MIQFEPDDIERIRERLREMSESDLLRYGQASRHMADPKAQYGIPRVTATGFPIDPSYSSDSCCVLDHEAQRLREEEWLQRIKGREFQRALVIVGIAHSLSLQRRLSEAGFSVKLWAYEPHAKLCGRKHSG